MKFFQIGFADLGSLCKCILMGEKEFCNKIADELYSLLNIKLTKTLPAHPQCNEQVEVFNKTLAKYVALFVDLSTLDWEQFIPAMMFSYNTSYHSTIMTTPFVVWNESSNSLISLSGCSKIAL